MLQLSFSYSTFWRSIYFCLLERKLTNKENNTNKLSESPCVRNCCLNGDDICLGCFRHIDEIVAWRSYNSQERLQVITLCEERRESKPKFG